MKITRQSKVLPESSEAETERVTTQSAQVAQLQCEIELLRTSLLPSLKEDAKTAIEAVKAHIFAAAREHFDMRETRILKQTYALLTHEAMWETEFVPGTIKDRAVVEKLYQKGFRYLGSAYDANLKAGGTMYHRPKPPISFEKFRELYERTAVDPKKEEPKKAPVATAKKKLVLAPKKTKK